METNHPDFELEPRPKMKLEPGKHYTGTFWLNEHGEFCCRPANKGSRPFGGAYSLLYEGENYTICESTNTYKLMVKWPKRGLTITSAVAVIQAAIIKLSTYLTRK